MTFWRVAYKAGYLLLALAIFLVFLSALVHFMVPELAWWHRATYAILWGLVFRWIANAVIRGFKNRWRETHEDWRGPW
jgi:hypothetical protein